MLNNADMLGMLNNMEQINGLLASTGTSLPINWTTMTPQDKQLFLSKLMTESEKAKGVAQAIDDNAKSQKDMLTHMDQQGVNVEQPIQAGKKFNLKKAQMQMPLTGNMAPAEQPAGQLDQNQQFNDGSDVKKWLEAIGDPNAAIDVLRKKYTNSNQIVTDPTTNASEEALGVIKEAVNAFFSTNDEQQKLAAASQIFDNILPDSAKINGSQNDEIPTQLETGVQPHLANIIQQSNLAIKKLAEEHAQKTAKSFNLKKMAQHQTLQNVMMFGPGQKVDAFTGQLISDWHLVERNKGFGLKIDDVQNIDFEAIWRGNIMDKFYRPYRDKDGNWVGGYLENRFEIDKNIPPLSNMQLKPGERRRPYLPEYGPTEARLEASRDKLNKERGYAPAEKGKVFNWKEASKKKVLKEGSKEVEIAVADSLNDSGCRVSAVKDEAITAQLKPLKELKLPGEKTLNTGPTFKCPACRSVLSPSTSKCPNCNSFIGKPVMDDPKTAPDKPGRQRNDVYVQKGSLLPGHQPHPAYNAKLSSVLSADAIFHDGTAFIVYSNREKRRFSTFDEAEAFKESQSQILPKKPIAKPIAPPVQNKRTPVQSKPLHPVDKQRVLDRHQSAHGLAIDG